MLSGDDTVGGDLPVAALQVADLSVAGLVVDEVVAGRAVPACLEKGAARGVLRADSDHASLHRFLRGCASPYPGSVLPGKLRTR